VTIMQMVPPLDAGPILLQHRTSILADETAGELALRLSELGAGALIEALALLELGLARPVAQDDTLATYAPKLTRESAQVDWTRSAHEVSSHVRAYDPKPGAWGRVNGVEVKLFGARLAPRSRDREAGEVIAIGPDGMLVACGGGAIRVAVVQPAGKRKLAPLEWANGRGVAVGDRFDTRAPAPA
jgi:methionyl-tRNA formyltransferase